MKHYLSIAAALLLAACSEKSGYEIAGTVSNAELNGKYVYLYEYMPNATPLDSALVQNGAFKFKGVQDEPTVAFMRFSEEVIPTERGKAPFTTFFTLENGKLTATLDTVSIVTGTPANDTEKALKDDITPLIDEINKLRSDFRSEDKNIVNAAEKKYSELGEKITQAIYAYIMANTDQKMAAKYLSDNRYNLSEEQQNTIIAQASSAFKAFPGIDKLMEHLETLKKVAIGKSFTDFEMADINGNMHKLSEYVGNGKVVLIDFWASWCGPCRRSMPELIEIYNRNKAAGFDVIGISLDDKKEAWEKGIKDLNLPWTQLSDLQGWRCAGAALYGVNSIPHTVLVGKDGTIIAKNLHGQELEDKIKEVLK